MSGGDAYGEWPPIPKPRPDFLIPARHGLWIVPDDEHAREWFNQLWAATEADNKARALEAPARVGEAALAGAHLGGQNRRKGSDEDRITSMQDYLGRHPSASVSEAATWCARQHGATGGVATYRRAYARWQAQQK